MKAIFIILFALGIGFSVGARELVVSPGVDALGKAISAARAGDVIFVKNGTYKKSAASLEVKQRNITIIGESREGVVVTGNNYSGKSQGVSTADTYTMLVEGNNFYAENITVENTATQAQAVALLSSGDSMVLSSCCLRGYQDTHYAQTRRQYFVGCEARGDVDFILGDAAVMYDHSVIVSRSRKGGYITAPSDAKILTGALRHGIVIKNSELRAEDGLADNTCTLGRPWGDHNTSAVYIGCKMGSHIKPEGWTSWNDANTFMAEYGSTTLGGDAADVSQRVAWSRQLVADDTASYAIEQFFKGWDPRTKAQSALLPAPAAVYVSGDTLRWGAVDEARCYLVFRNDSLQGCTARPAYYIGGKPDERYSVKTANRYGRLGAASSGTTTAVEGSRPAPDYKAYAAGRVLHLPENEAAEVYSLLGVKVLSSAKSRQVPLAGLATGIYLVRILLDGRGSYITQKIIIN
ncbi:MAG: T9SS type A sorting domain-containing protein [Prevotellaceae bacterium]|jgi:pectinesterase|nr:T9SS type A sorting domain-containing protein [Prevotellaceae bacterium]